MSATSVNRRGHRPRRPLSQRTLRQDSVRALLVTVMVISGLVSVSRPAPAQSWVQEPLPSAPGASLVQARLNLPPGARLLQIRAQQQAQAQAEAARTAAREAKIRASRMSKVVMPAWGPMSARFGTRGRHWETGRHTGVDFRLRVGTPVRSFKYGTVTFAGWDGAYGRKIVIRHANGVQSVYAHLSKITVRVGDTVEAGERIGRSGRSGNSTGPHLHFEIIKHGTQVDPLPYLRGKRA